MTRGGNNCLTAQDTELSSPDVRQYIGQLALIGMKMMKIPEDALPHVRAHTELHSVSCRPQPSVDC
jgi:hypothetical protein